jgi:hypothetical protein
LLVYLKDKDVSNQSSKDLSLVHPRNSCGGLTHCNHRGFDKISGSISNFYLQDGPQIRAFSGGYACRADAGVGGNANSSYRIGHRGVVHQSADGMRHFQSKSEHRKRQENNRKCSDSIYETESLIRKEQGWFHKRVVGYDVSLVAQTYYYAPSFPSLHNTYK